MENTTQVDITKYPEGPQEVIKYMDYMPEDDGARLRLLMGYLVHLISR